MKAFTTQEVPLADRLFGWWYDIAAPPEVPDEAPLRLRMRVRSGRLTSVVFLMEIVIVLVIIVEYFFEGRILSNPTPIMALIPLVIGVILNRNGKTISAGILVFAAEEVAVIMSNFLLDRGVSTVVLVDSFFFLAPELIAAEMIAPWVTFPVTLCNCILTVTLIIFLPRTPDLVLALHRAPLLYAAPVEIQILVSVVCFLWVSSTYKEMKRANTAEEVTKLTMEIAKQQQVVQMEKQQLEESIKQIVSVHTQVANGNLHARVPLGQGNVLWSVAGSLNNLLARLQRHHYDALEYQRYLQAHQQLLQNIQMARRQGKPLQAYTTGTPLDGVILEFSKGMAAPQQTLGMAAPQQAVDQSINFKHSSSEHF